MFRVQPEKAQEKLEKKLSQVGTTSWYIGSYVKNLLKIAFVAYAINAKVQTARFLASDAYQSRQAVVKHAYTIGEDLYEDPVFHSSFKTYIHTKARVKPEFEAEVKGLTKNLDVAKDTKEEFRYEIKRIYNPFVMF